VYQLVRPSGFADVAEYVWNRWRRFNRLESYEDVTSQVIDGATDDNPG